MGYIDEHLLQGESVVYQTQLHWIIYSRSFLAGLLAVVLVLFGVSTSTSALSELGGAFLLIAVVLAVRAMLIQSGGEFVVTNKRILLKVGNLRRRSVELMLDKVESLTVDQPLGGRLLDYGSVILRGTGGTNERFDLIASPFEFRRQALQQIENGRTPVGV